MKWISVKDKLPEQYDWVFVTYPDMRNNGAVEVGYWCKHKHWHCWNESEIMDVSHWMPLEFPEPAVVHYLYSHSMSLNLE